MIEWHVGTSGFSFDDWIGTVYPTDIKKEEMFTYYWYHYGFNCVELNFTFYQIPSEKTMVRLVRKAPQDFLFAVKLHSSITHDGKLDEIDNFVSKMTILEEEHRLIGYLAQFPYSFRMNSKNIDFIHSLAERISKEKLYIEFRHASWSDYCKETCNDFNYVAVDLPKIGELFPLIGNAHRGENIYVRLHGRNPDWFKADEKKRYDYNYTVEELSEIISMLVPENISKAFVFFNNCYRGQALKNATTFRTIIGGE